MESKIKETDDIGNAPGEIPLDPFAVDFFGRRNPAQIEEINISVRENKRSGQTRARAKKPSNWYKNLPRLSAREVEFSNSLQNLPQNFTRAASAKICEILARYTFRQPRDVKCSIISTTEINLGEAVSQSAKSPKVFLTVGCQPDNAAALIALDTEFAFAVIDLILTGKSGDFTVPHNLSPIEHAIIEFLGINILGEINNWLGQSLLCLQNIAEHPTPVFDANERGAELVIRVSFESFAGIISVFAPWNFLKTLDKTQNPLFARPAPKDRARAFEKIAPNFNLRLQIGTTYLDGESLLYLEPDDIVLVEEQQIDWRENAFSGDLQICVGSGRNFRLGGKLAENGKGKVFTDELSFKIEEISSEAERREMTKPPERLAMDENENEVLEREETAAETETEQPLTATTEEPVGKPDTEDLSALENVLVALRVEIAGNKISLRELQNLRSGQIIALGCRPTDPVRLVTDNNDQPVAIGELVDIEGKLGVRLTRVFI